MVKTVKISVIFLALTLVFLPKASYAWGDRHRFHSHRNPDLTLVTGMDNIDSRVLIASDSSCNY